jgi:hypothetical protein
LCSFNEIGNFLEKRGKNLVFWKKILYFKYNKTGVNMTTLVLINKITILCMFWRSNGV